MTYNPDFFKDIPAAYAVMEGIFEDDKLVDARYIFVNRVYGSYMSKRPEELLGKTYHEAFDNRDSVFKDEAQVALEEMKLVKGYIYSEEAKHWLFYSIMPLSKPRHFSIVTASIDSYQKTLLEKEKNWVTDDGLLRIAGILVLEKDYNKRMNRVLEEIGKWIHGERVYVNELSGDIVADSFEWNAPGIESVMDQWQHIDKSKYIIGGVEPTSDTPNYITDIESIKDTNPERYSLMRTQDIHNVIEVPLLTKNDRFIGYLGVDNIEDTGKLDTEKFLSSVARFVANEISNQRRMQEMERLGTHDSLTGIYNRWSLDTEISKYLVQHPEAPHVAVMIDIDDFKQINDLHGHKVGDIALQTLANDLRSFFDGRGIYGRNGGDEFLVLIQKVNMSQARELIYEFSKMQHRFTYNGNEYSFTISMGYAGYPEDGNTMEQLLKKADAAMYVSKLRGKHRFLAYSANMEEESRTVLGFGYRTIAENMPGALMVYKQEEPARILYANKNLIMLFECENLKDFLDFTGGTWKGMVLKEEQEKVEQSLIKQNIENLDRTRNTLIYHIQTKTGKVKKVLVNGHIATDPNYGVVHYVVYMEMDDVLEIK